MRGAGLGLVALVGSTTCGCVSFAPGYQPEIYRRLTATSDDIAKLAAAAELDGGQISYAKAEPYYIDALGNLDGAVGAAAVQRQARAGSPAAESAGLLVAAVANCRSALIDIAVRNKASPVTSTLLADSGLAEVCSVARTMEGRLQKTDE